MRVIISLGTLIYIEKMTFIVLVDSYRDVKAPVWGARGREFESHRSDHLKR